MGTQNKTVSTAQFNPQSMGQFNQLQGTIGTQLQQNINDPFHSMMFNTQLGMQRQANQAQFGSQQQALLQRSQALGVNPQSPQYAYMLNQLQRQNSSNTAQGYNNLLLQASQRQQQSLGMAESYRPLQTGQTNVQSQSGLGTWLPQLAGAAIGGLTGGLMGGGKQSGGGDFYSGAGASPNIPAARTYDTSQAPPLF